MIKYLLIFIFILVILFLCFPNIVESLLRKNHFKSKNDIVKKYIIPNIPKKFGPIKILDFGSGSGALSLALKNNMKCEVVPLDFKDVHEYGNKPILYDGYNIPFKDNQFDVVICIFVLHHIPHQMKIIDELKRVTKKRLLIMEDCNNTFVDKLLTFVHGYSSYGKCKKCFHSKDEWTKIFEKKKLKVKKIISVPRLMLPIYPVARSLFVLDK